MVKMRCENLCALTIGVGKELTLGVMERKARSKMEPPRRQSPLWRKGERERPRGKQSAAATSSESSTAREGARPSSAHDRQKRLRRRRCQRGAKERRNEMMN